MTRSTISRMAAIMLLAAMTASLSAAVAVPPQVAPPPATQPVDPTRPTTTRASQPTPEPRTIDQLRRELWELERRERWHRRPALRVGQDYTLRAGETVADVAVVFGDARIEGRIDGDLVVVMGNARLGATAVIEGSFVVVGGEADIEPGAVVRRDVVTIGTTLNAPGDFIFAGEHIVIGNAVLGDWMRTVAPWLTYGLLWGRPIVPSIPWVWTVIFAFFVVYLLVNLLLHEPVRATADVLARRPFGTFLVGLLVLLMWAPISALLAVSIVGIIVIPFFLSALVVAAVVGRVAVARMIGNSLIAPDDPASRVLALRSFVFGFVLLTLTYMVPVLGFVAWGLVGVFGLGAAVMAFLAAWRKETPKEGAQGGAQLGAQGGAQLGAQTGAQVGAQVGAQTGAQWSAAGAAPSAPSAFAPAEPSPTSPTPSASAPPERLRTSPAPPSQTRATFLDRAIAFGLDVVLVAVVHEGLEGTFFPRYSEFFFPLLLIYFIAFWTWKGTTVGGIVMKLRIVKVNGAPFEAADAIVRALAGVLSFAAVGLGVLWILRSDDVAGDGLPARQGWHDKAVGTFVVKE